jgi:lysophospholipase L1-like esterase
MSNKLYSLGILLLSLAALLSCKPKYEKPAVSKGEIDPTRFVMIGGAHSSGYMNDALYYDGQQNSLAVLISNQISLVGGNLINQPFVNSTSVGIGLTGLAQLKLGYKTDCKGVTSLSPVRVSATGDGSIFSDNLYSSSTKFGNYGIPGLKLMDVATANYGQSNSFFGRMASSSATSVLNDVTATNATFFTSFLGVEDVLDFAKSGGTITNLPSVNDFENTYTNLIQQLTANGAKGAIATIPDVTEMPYFTTIPWNGLTLDAANNSTLNSIYNPLGYYFTVGSNPFMIVDPTANDFAVRQILSDELLLLSLPLDSVKCNQMGVLFPIRDEFVLDQGEIQELRSRIQELNAVIISLANQYNLALVRVDDFSSSLKTGFVYNGVSMSAKFVSGGAYSLDGIHYNAKGNALLANEFLKSINNKYKSRIPLLNANAFDATLFP